MSHENGTDVPRLPSGTQHLDQILCGGWLRGGLYILAGPPGAGKTTLANQCAYAAAERGEPTVYVTMLAETHDRMTLHLRSLDFFRHDRVGTLVHCFAGSAALKDGGVAGLAAFLGRLVRAKLLVIDGFAPVKERAAGRVELREHLQALSVQAALHDCTTVLLSSEDLKGAEIEYAMADGILALSADLRGLKATRGVEAICDNVLFLRLVELYGRLQRLIAVLKMRDCANDPFLRELRLSAEGVRIGGTYASIEAMMTGQPRDRGPRATPKPRRATPKRAASGARGARR